MTETPTLNNLYTLPEELHNLPFVLVRTYSAGVHVGFLFKRDGPDVTLKHSRRVYKWVGGALSLSELATTGPSDFAASQICVPVETMILTGAIEIISTTERAKQILLGMPNYEV